jgi:hypothetical protein
MAYARTWYIVFKARPVIEAVNDPVPEPLSSQVLDVVGFADVLQQTPRPITVAPPLAVTLPPPVAVVCVIALAAAVVTVGTAGPPMPVPLVRIVCVAGWP